MRRVLQIALVSACFFAGWNARAQKPPAQAHGNSDQLLQAAENARDENRDDDAIKLFRQVLSDKPESEQALWYLGTLLYEKGQYPEACDVLLQFLTLRPDAGPAWAFVGLGEFQQRKYSLALDHLQRAMAQGMGDRQELVQVVFQHVVILLTRFERFDDSLDMMGRMTANDSSHPELVPAAGLAGLRLPLLPDEIPADRRELVDLAGQAVLAVQNQHHEEAASAFAKLLADYPNEPGVHFLHGVYLAELHPDEAAAEFEKELEISPSHVLARVRLAEQLIAQRNYDRALELARQAIALDPRRASGHLMAGEALVGKGEFAAGIKELEVARGDDPAMSRAHWDLLRAYTTAGRKEDADREKHEIETLLRNKTPMGGGTGGDIRRDSTTP